MRIRVPVKLDHPKVSDALANTNFITLQNSTAIPININGESLNDKDNNCIGYILGDNDNNGTITIQGKLVDLINAFDVGFYASAWKGQKTAMTVKNIDAWIHENESTRTQIGKYEPLKTAILTELSGDKLTGTLGTPPFSIDFDLTETAVSIVTKLLENGVPRDGSLISLTEFIHPSTITFRKIIENGIDGLNEEGNADIIILDEEPIHKKIDALTIDKQLFANRFPGAKFEGLSDILNNRATPTAQATSQVLYDNVVENFCKNDDGTDKKVPIKIDESFSLGPIQLGAVNIDSDVTFRGILNAFFNSPDSMCALLRKLEIKVDIITFPYSDNVADYGVKGDPKTPTNSLNPMILWGLDVYGPNSSAPVVSE